MTGRAYLKGKGGFAQKVAADGREQIRLRMSQCAGGLCQVDSSQCRQALERLLDGLPSQGHEHGQLRLFPAHTHHSAGLQIFLDRCEHGSISAQAKFPEVDSCHFGQALQGHLDGLLGQGQEH